MVEFFKKEAWLILILFIMTLSIGFLQFRANSLAKENAALLQEKTELRLKFEAQIKQSQKAIEEIVSLQNAKERLNKQTNSLKAKIQKENSNDAISPSLNDASNFILGRLRAEN